MLSKIDIIGLYLIKIIKRNNTNNNKNGQQLCLDIRTINEMVASREKLGSPIAFPLGSGNTMSLPNMRTEKTRCNGKIMKSRLMVNWAEEESMAMGFLHSLMRNNLSIQNLTIIARKQMGTSTMRPEAYMIETPTTVRRVP
jgi:hypothetical protein